MQSEFVEVSVDNITQSCLGFGRHPVPYKVYVLDFGFACVVTMLLTTWLAKRIELFYVGRVGSDGYKQIVHDRKQFHDFEVVHSSCDVKNTTSGFAPSSILSTATFAASAGLESIISYAFFQISCRSFDTAF